MSNISGQIAVFNEPSPLTMSDVGEQFDSLFIRVTYNNLQMFDI